MDSLLRFRRWLLVGALLCALIGAGSLTLALCCMFDLIGGACELWLLGPLIALPLGLGLGLIGRASGQSAVLEASKSVEPQGCSEREET